MKNGLITERGFSGLLKVFLCVSIIFSSNSPVILADGGSSVGDESSPTGAQTATRSFKSAPVFSADLNDGTVSVTPPFPKDSLRGEGPLSNPQDGKITTFHGIGTANPHDHDPKPIQDEHERAMGLVAVASANSRVVSECTAERRCAFSADSSWESKDENGNWVRGRKPADGARVHVPAGSVIVVDGEISSAFDTIRLDGKLTYAVDRNTEINVKTMVITSTGELEIGTESAPVSGAFTAKLTFEDRAFDAEELEIDPSQIGNGLIAHGKVTVCGQEKASSAPLAQFYQKGGREIVLAGPIPTGWKNGDLLVLASPVFGGTEKLKVVGLSTNETGRTTVRVVGVDDMGNEIANWRGFKNSGEIAYGQEAGVYGMVSNLTRNVVLATKGASGFGAFFNSEVTRAHVMIMHAAGKAVLKYLQLAGLGRTDANKVPDNARFDEDGELIPGSGLNQIGRYALHFHRTGADGFAQTVKGIAVAGSLLFGIANHSSKVNVDDAIVYGARGASYFTERGDETGSFVNAVAMDSGVDNRTSAGLEALSKGAAVLAGKEPLEFFGTGGHGFWIHGSARVTLRNVFASGARLASVVVYTKALSEKGIPKFTLENGRSTEESIVDTIKGVTVFGGRGFGMQYLYNTPPSGRFSVLEGLRLLGGGGLYMPYSTNVKVVDSFIGGYFDKIVPGSIGVRSNATTGRADALGQIGEMRLERVTIRGFAVGVDVPQNGAFSFTGGTVQNSTDFLIDQSLTNDRRVFIDGRTVFLPLTTGQSRAGVRTKIQLRSAPLDANKAVNLSNFFKESNDIILFGDRRIYYPEQARGYVPFPRQIPQAPAFLIGKTNQEIWNLYGISTGGQIASEDAQVQADIKGVVGRVPASANSVFLQGSPYTNVLNNLNLKYTEVSSTGVATVRSVRVPRVNEGWNLVPVTLAGGRTISLLVFGDVTPPEFVPTSGGALSVRAQDIGKTFTITGNVVDASLGTVFRRLPLDLTKFPITTLPDGRRVIRAVSSVSDASKNKKTLVFEITVI